MLSKNPNQGPNYSREFFVEPQVRLREQARQAAHSFQFIHNLCSQLQDNTRISPEEYIRWDIKRGLRDNDGTGVQAGITQLGNVEGYYFDGDQKVPMEGQLIYRGVNVMDLIDGFLSENRSGFEETTYLLLFGSLPSKSQLQNFKEILASFRALPHRFTEEVILSAPSPDIMNKLSRAILSMYSFDPDPENSSLHSELNKALQIIARSPVIIARAWAAKRHYCDRLSLFLHPPQPQLSVAENLLYMSRLDTEFTEEEARLLDLCLVLHAEHGGGNNSTFACRVLSSSGTDIYSALGAAVGSLKGPKHGGANLRVVEMLRHIKAEVSDWTDDGQLTDYLVKLLKGQAGDGSGLIYGMGHAIYTLSDPRAVTLKKYARELAGPAGMEKDFQLAERIERLSPALFREVRKNDKPMCANVDLYSGLVYQMMGMPEELYTPIFAVARTPSWCAHRIEEIFNPMNRIIRPAYREVAPRAEYRPLDER